MRNIKLLLVIIVMTLSSCKIYFTDSTRKRIQSADTDKIEKVQFYNDRKIIIEYRTTSKDEIVKGGKVKFKEGYYYYQVKFPKGTPAVAKNLDKDRLKVYFESGEDRYLVFGAEDKYYTLFGNKKGKGFFVNFEGKEFRVIEGANAFLMIKKNDVVVVDVNKRKVKGVKVD